MELNLRRHAYVISPANLLNEDLRTRGIDSACIFTNSFGSPSFTKAAIIQQTCSCSRCT